jgi:hypothetical protein
MTVMWWIFGGIMAWFTRKAVTQHNQAKTLSQVPDWGDSSRPGASRATYLVAGAGLLLALVLALASLGAAIYVALVGVGIYGLRRGRISVRNPLLTYFATGGWALIGLAVSVFSLGYALLFLALAAALIWSRRLPRSFVNTKVASGSASSVATSNLSEAYTAVPELIEAGEGSARPSAGTWYKTSGQAPVVETADRGSGRAPKNAVQLYTGGWADLSTATTLCSWQGPTQNHGKQTFTVYRTRRGSLILKEPATGINWGPLGSTNITYKYAEGTEQQIVEVMVKKDAAREAKQVFPAVFEAMRAEHYASER